MIQMSSSMLPLCSIGSNRSRGISGQAVVMRCRSPRFEKNLPLNQDEMVQCTNEELWRTAPKVKDQASGDVTKRATKVFDTASEATRHKAAQGKGTVLMVPGTPKRCSYCYAAPICEQRLQMVGGDNE